MSGVIEAVDWQENADELHALYKAERNVEARKLLLALWSVGPDYLGGARFHEALAVSRRRRVPRLKQ